MEAKREVNLNMFPSQEQNNQKLGLNHQISVNDIQQKPVNSPKIHEFLKENEGIKIDNNSGPSQSSITDQSYAEINQCYAESKMLSETSSDSEYSWKNEAENKKIDHTLAAPTTEGRKVILSKKETENSGIQKYSHLLPGGQNIDSASSSKFSEEFFHNEANISESNNNTSSISSQNKPLGNMNLENSEDSYTSPMSSQQENSEIIGNYQYPQSDLSYSYSDIDPQDADSQYFDEFINKNKGQNEPQMQVFNYEPVFKENKNSNFNYNDEGNGVQDISEQKQPLNMLIPLNNPHSKEQKSIADGYREKKLQLTHKLAYTGEQENVSQNIKKSGPKVYAGGRTKEQILALRREMMRPKGKKTNHNSNLKAQKNNSKIEKQVNGEKSSMNKKEMLKFTKKNY